MTAAKRLEEALNLDVKLVNCAGCHVELLGDGYLAGLRDRSDWSTWPALASGMFQQRRIVYARLFVGTELRPFCKPCTKGGRVENARRRHAERLSEAGAVRAVQVAVP